MIIANKINDVQIEGEALQSSGKMHISLDKSGHLIRMLTRAYADKIGSIIRESVANAKDSHTMAGTEDPVIVRIVKQTNGEEVFEVQDFGLGLDDKEFFKYIMGIGESTKQNIANVIGGYGIGAKAASSYHDSSSYFYTCRKEGVERKYMIYADEEQPNSTLIYEKPTEERNGVTVSIPIKHGDLWEFKNKIKEQLAYFSRVYFENCDINNNFKIYRNELYQYSEISNSKVMHISLDDVYYAIDFNKLGSISPVNIPVALRFSLTDGITVIPNRENIEYTKDTKALIIQRISEVADSLIGKYNQTMQEFTDIEDIFKFYRDSKEGRYEIVPFIPIDLSPLRKYSKLSFEAPKFKGIEKLNIYTLYAQKANMLNCYKITDAVINGKMRNGDTKTRSFWSPTVISLVTDGSSKKPILYDTPITGKKRQFIKETYPNCYFIKKSKKFHLKREGPMDDCCLKSILSLNSYDRGDWRQVIKEWYSIVEIFEKKLTKEEDIVITQAWLDSKKTKRVQSKRLEGEINFKFARKNNKGDGAVFEGAVVNLKDLSLQSKLVIYGNLEDRVLLENLFEANKNKHIKIAIVGKSDFKKLEELKYYKFKNINKFMEEYSRILCGYASSKRVKDIITKYPNIFKLKKEIKTLSLGFHEELVALEDFSNKYPYIDNTLLNSIITLCEVNNWKNFEIEAICNSVEESIKKWDFIRFFEETSYYSNSKLKEGSIPIIKELLTARKFRMDWHAPVVPKEELKEETLEEFLEEASVDEAIEQL